MTAVRPLLLENEKWLSSTRPKRQLPIWMKPSPPLKVEEQELPVDDTSRSPVPNGMAAAQSANAKRQTAARFLILMNTYHRKNFAFL
jgi:hypothetical protein